jgi:UDP-N-acetylmuramoyl-tripeptide--D-alanyl-D-alanine ligase
MSLWSAAEVAAATGAKVNGSWLADGVSIDTRNLKPGDLFVALKDVRDGHDFVADALAKGASAALVSHIPDGVDESRCALVPDVLQALESLGEAGRARSTAQVVGVTGSAGKTSTKEMLRVVLAGQGRVHAAEASYNNHWGVPLTLARLPKDADFAVIEIGMNHPGEIAPLAHLARPHVALITTIAPAHLAAFPDEAGIAAEKATIFEGLEPGGVAVWPLDLAVSPVIAEQAKSHANYTFGQSDAADFRLRRVVLTHDQTVIEAAAPGQMVLTKLAVPGRHFAMNALAVLAVIRALDLDMALAAVDLQSWHPPAGRGTREIVVMDLVHEEASFELIDDAFNANPASMAAAIEVLAASEPKDGIGRFSKGRRIAVLGDMLELGTEEDALHRAIATLPGMDKVTLVHCAGPRMKGLWQTLPEERRGQWRASAQELAAEAKSIADGGDVVLVKGSKGSKVSLVAEALRRLGQPLERRIRGEE